MVTCTMYLTHHFKELFPIIHPYILHNRSYCWMPCNKGSNFVTDYMNKYPVLILLCVKGYVNSEYSTGSMLNIRRKSHSLIVMSSVLSTHIRLPVMVAPGDLITCSGLHQYLKSCAYSPT